MGTKRKVSPVDQAKFWAALQAGKSQKEAAALAGIHINTASKWVAKLKAAEAAETASELRARKVAARDGGVQMEAYNRFMDAVELPGAIPHDMLSPEAKRGLEDFGFFREYYLGRIPSPWQVEAAVTLVELEESEDKEFVVINVAPGAGKSTLMHDVAVWAICRNRAIRILIGSVSQNMAKLYSRRIRETLERPMPIEPDPELVRKGLAQKAQGCLAVDYGRFKPVDKGALWRADEFIVEQIDGNGTNDKEPTVRAYGIEAEFIGHRADMCLFDDVASPDNSRESVARDKLLERWDNVAEARVDPGGLLAVIGQRLGAGDLYAHCLAKETFDEDIDDIYDGSDVTSQDVLEAIEPPKRKKYRHIIYKAYYDELDVGSTEERKKLKRFDAPPWPDGPLLDPKRVPWKDLSFIRHSKPDVFAVVYQQEDLDLDNRLIDRTWITGGVGRDGVQYQGCVDQDRRPGWPPGDLAQPWTSMISIDPSPTNFWALIWTIYQPNLNLYHVVDIERTKLTAEDLLGFNTTTREYSGLLNEWVERAEDLGFPVSHVIVEINAAQRFLLAHDFVRKWQTLHHLNVVPHTTSRNKLDDNLGVEALLPPVIRSGALRLPSMRETWKTLALTDELVKWTRDKKHGTDLVMALWFTLLHAHNVSGFRSPPRMWRPSWMMAG